MDVASYQFQEQRKHCLSNIEHWDNASAEQKNHIIQTTQLWLSIALYT